jgi:preprotein translocase subunit SecD
MNWKKIFTNWKVIILILFLIFSYYSINGGLIPQLGNEGVAIRSVAPNSSAALGGIENPSAKLQPLQKERIIRLDSTPITNEQMYYEYLSTVPENTTLRVVTDKTTYTLITPKNGDIGVRVYDAPTSNLRKGLDLEGGTRVLLAPKQSITAQDLETTIDSLKERLNVYGLSDIVVTSASDLEGNDFILIEIAGVTEQEVQELLAKQGKFDAKIGNNTVFKGGDKDITYVCRSAQCSGINPQYGCQGSGASHSCQFFFEITLSGVAAQRQADLTRNLPIVTAENGQRYLSEDLRLFLDEVEVDTLRIGASLKGSTNPGIQISGSGEGRTEQEAITNTLENMKRLQTIIITGSLPVQLEVVKLDSISASLGQEFLDNILLVGVLAILSVITVVYVRYRRIKVVIPIVVTLFSELLLILGFASLVGWNLDLAGIAGIIIVAGTGVDHLIIITDETIRGEKVGTWKRRIKNAMFIVLGAYLTTLAGMLPLLWAGAGLLKGFALITITGVSFGVLIARPAYAAIIEILLDDE